MNIPIPSIEQIREALQPLTIKQLEELEKLSGVPATTIYKIKRGETANPGVETIGRFMPHVAAVLRAAEPAAPGPDRRQPSDHCMQSSTSGRDVAAALAGVDAKPEEA